MTIAGCDCGEELIVTDARLAVTPLAVDFGNVVVGGLRVRSVELSNTGAVPLSLTKSELVSDAQEFAFVSQLPEMIAPQQKVEVNIAFEPRDVGAEVGTITFAANDGKDPITVTLNGVGVESGVGIELEGERCGTDENSLSFGNLTPGTSASRTITVTSQGGTTLTVLSAIVEAGSTGEWTIDGSALPQALEPGASLQLVATYTPVDGGADQGAFVITTDATANSTIRITACGAGVAPALCGRPVPLDLGSVGAGQTISGLLTLESCGLEPLNLTALQLANDANHPLHPAFSFTSSAALPATLAPGETVAVNVSFTGQAPLGAASAWIQASSNAHNQPQSFFRIDARTAAPCALYVAPTDLSFRNVAIGASGQHTALLGNSGEIDCEISSVVVNTTVGMGNEFALASALLLPFTLRAGDAQLIDVAYSPQDANMHEGTLVATDASGTTVTVSLFGNPPEATGCAIEAQPTAVNFGITPVGVAARLGVTIVNVGDDPCRITGAVLVNGEPAFAVNMGLLPIAFPGFGGVDLEVVYTPTMPSASTDVIQVDAMPLGMGTGGGTIFVGVTGQAAEARICATPASVDFGVVTQGSSATRSVVISSCGAAPLNLRGVVLSSGTGGPFSIANRPVTPDTLASGDVAMPDLSVVYAPMDPGPHFGEVEVLSSDRTQPALRIPLTGNWDGTCSAVLSCNPTAIDFGDTEIATRKMVRVVCRNLSNSPVNVTNAVLAGGGSELTVDAMTPVALQPGDVWTFDVHYLPNAAVASSATLNLTTDACIAPAAIPVAGNGLVRDLPPCQPPSTFQPQVQWHWRSSTIEPTFTNSWSTPLVANLNDDNGDQLIDENDIPEVVFISLDSYSISDPAASIPGVLRVLNGATGVEEFSVNEPRFADTSLLAIGDIDSDGKPEIIGSKWIPTPPGTGTGGFFGRYMTGVLVALDNTGAVKWESDPWSWPQELTWNSSAPSLADLDGDGFAEIILGREVFDHRGHLLWRGTGDHGLVSGGVHSAVADITGDGRPEIVAGGTVYNADGSILWDLTNGFEGGTAIGMLDPLDPLPQIVRYTANQVTVIDHLGIEKWSATIPVLGMMSTPSTLLPVIADFNGDGDGDVAVANGEAVYVYNGTGGLLWSSPVTDSTCCVGISAFDFEGDGVYELILTDYGTVYVYRGTDGTQVYSAARTSPTAYEMPVVADIDNDGKGELVVALMGTGMATGVIAYSNINDTWVGAPRIFNQQTYHVTNVYENGAIPRVETPLSQGPNVFRGTIAACE
jgi:hypothetical protein